MNAEDVSKGVIFSRGEPMPEPISQNFTGKVYVICLYLPRLAPGLPP